MELWGRWIAQSWTYQPDSFPGFRQNEIRLTNVARTDTRQVAAMVSGEGGQTYLGPSVVDGRVAFAKVCQGDPGGCSPSTSGPVRYRISNGAYQLVGESEQWSGWAFDGTADFHVPSDFDCSGGDPGSPPSEPCGIYRRTGLPWNDAAGATSSDNARRRCGGWVSSLSPCSRSPHPRTRARRRRSRSRARASTRS